jgi:hypothetical protein
MKLIENGHITETAFKAFAGGLLDKEQSLQFAEHVSVCDECTARMIQAMELCALKAPKGFTEAVSLKLESNLAQKQREFRLYCTRIAACIAAVIGISAAGIIYMPAFAADYQAPPPTVTEAPAPNAIQAPPPAEQDKLWDRVGTTLSNIADCIFNSEESTDDKTT